MKEIKPLSCMVIAAQIVLLILMLIIAVGPGRFEYQRNAMSLMTQLKQGVEQYRSKHKAYPRDLAGIAYHYYDDSGEQQKVGTGVRDARSGANKYETMMGKISISYGPAAEKESAYELKVWGEDAGVECYTYTGDPFIYLKRIPRGLGFAQPALMAFSLFLSIRTIIRALYRRAPGEGPRRITVSQVISVAVSTVFIVAALALLFASIPRSKEPSSYDFHELQYMMDNAQAYYHDHKRYPRDLRELTGLSKGQGPIWLPYGYTIEFGPIRSRPNQYALRAISKDRNIVYEMYTDKTGLYSRKKDEKEDAAKLM